MHHFGISDFEIVPRHLVFVGGGCLCFSFGAHFNGTFELRFSEMPSFAAQNVHSLRLLASVCSPAVDLLRDDKASGSLEAVSAALPTFNCAVCQAPFASKNKLYAHLTAAGHRNRT